MQEIKVHQTIIEAIIVCLKAIFEEQKVADKEVGFALKQNKQFGSRDRSMIAESVYDIVRWKIKYEYQLQLAGAQFNLYKHLLLVSLLNRNYSIKNPEIFNVNNEELLLIKNKTEQIIEEAYIAQSYPKEFYAFCENSIGNAWHNLAKALNEKPAIYIRTNRLKTTTQQLSSLLSNENVAHTIIHNNAIEILSKNNLKNSDLYKQGLFEFQDIGSQAIGNFLFNAIENNTNLNEIKILDLCAGAGGKTLHLSALLNNKGKIYATDYKAARLKNLQQRAQQAGCKNIEIIDFKEVKQLKNIDIVLIDAPCSGCGTFKRQADLKYKITQEKINEYQTIQASLLNEYKNCIHKKGKIIYATCSILPQENQQQINNFIKNNATYILENEKQLLPTEYDGDGFYMACIERKD